MKKILYKTIMVLLCISTFTGPVLAAAVVPSAAATSNPVTTPDPFLHQRLRQLLAEFKNLSRSERKLAHQGSKKRMERLQKTTKEWR